MITELRVENVRLFADRPFRFSLHPLTVICGGNSAGKSTLLKVPLFLRQSLLSRQTGPGKPVFNGADVDFGNFHALVEENDATRAITVGLTIHVMQEVPSLNRLLRRTGHESLLLNGRAGRL